MSADIKTARPKKNDPSVVVRDGKLLFISWTNKLVGNVFTTLHNGSVFLGQVRSRVEQGYHREVVKPMAIELYTQNMGGVHRADQAIGYCLNTHKTMKAGYKFCVQTSVLLILGLYINITILMQCITFSQNFRLRICEGFLKGYRCVSDPPTRLQSRHFPAINSDIMPARRQSKPDCVVCSVRGIRRCQTIYICKQCKLPMCPAPCFERYYTLKYYHIDCSPLLHKPSAVGM